MELIDIINAILEDYRSFLDFVIAEVSQEIVRFTNLDNSQLYAIYSFEIENDFSIYISESPSFIGSSNLVDSITGDPPTFFHTPFKTKDELLTIAKFYYSKRIIPSDKEIDEQVPSFVGVCEDELKVTLKTRGSDLQFGHITFGICSEII